MKTMFILLVFTINSFAQIAAPDSLSPCDAMDIGVWPDGLIIWEGGPEYLEITNDSEVGSVNNDWFSGSTGPVTTEACTEIRYMATYQNPTAPESIIDLLTLYDEYEKECYADSTDMGWGVWMSEMGVAWWYARDSTDTIFKPFHRYDHKEPTFIGFIEYLRKKVKDNF